MNSFAKVTILSLLTIALQPTGTNALAAAKSGTLPRPAAPAPATQPAAAADGQPLPQQLILSLKAAIAMAVHRNIDLRIEAQNSKMASVEAIKNRGIYNPVLNVSGTGGVTAVPGDAFFSTKNLNSSIGVTQNLPTGGSITATTQAGFFRFEPSTTSAKEWQSTAGVAVTQPLLRNAGKETFELNITLAASTHADSLERFRAATSETISSVITSYNRLYVLRQVQETRETAMMFAQTLLEAIRKKEQGSTQGLEIADAEFAIAQRRKDFIEASRNVMDQETNLRYLIGLETRLTIIPSDPPSKDEPTETDEQAVKAALDLRSDLRQLKTSLHSTQLQERVARHQSLPELSLNASGGFSGSGTNLGDSYRQIGNNPQTYWTAGMLFSVPLGNTTAHNEFIKSKIRTEQVQEQIKALSWKIRNDVETDMRALISARLQMQLANKSSQFAEQRLEQYRKNNLLKLASIQDVLNAENDLNVSRNAQVEAIETFSNAVTKLWKDTGLLLDRQGVFIDISRLGGAADGRVQDPYLTLDTPATTGRISGGDSEADQAPDTSQTPAVPLPAVAGQPATVGTLTNTPAVNKTYTLTIGEFSNRAVMTDAIAKIENVGLVPLVTEGAQKTEKMIRLYVGEFPNQRLAQKALKKIQLYKANGFIQLNEKKQHAVYAGSFTDQSAAALEQTRLAGHGINARPENASVTFTTYLLTAGNFLGREGALKFARRLEQMGLKPVVTEKP